MNIKAVKEFKIVAMPVGAGKKIEAGQFVGIKNTGYIEPYDDTQYDQYNYVCIAAESFDNTNGSDGYVEEEMAERAVKVYFKNTVAIVKTGETFNQSDRGNLCYAGGAGAKREPVDEGEKPLGTILNVLNNNYIEVLL